MMPTRKEGEMTVVKNRRGWKPEDQYYGINIQTYRIMSSLTQEQLADVTGMTQNKICLLENRQAKLGAAEAKLIARALGVSVDTLLAVRGS